jgi:hypothetical protein
LTSLASRPDSDRRGGSTFHDPARRFSVEIPAGWQRAREVVIPEVTNPREILVVSTFPLDGLGEARGPFYDHVLDHIGPGEGLVTVQERLGHAVAGPRVFPSRPAHFRLPPGMPEPRGCGHKRDRRPLRGWWIPFRAAGRDFYAQVVIGPRAPDSLRRDASRLLDSLCFERGPADAAGGGAGRGERAAFARLEARGLRLPALGADERCPLANAIELPGMSETRKAPFIRAEAALGPGDPGEPDPNKLLRRLRAGPLYVVFPEVPRIVDFFAPRTAEGEWRRAEVRWVSKPSYGGPVLVRGRQVDGPDELRFGAGASPRQELRLPAGSWMERRGPLRVWGRTAHPRKGWRMASSRTRFPSGSKSGIGCYAYQVDEQGFSYTIAFGGIRQG